MNSIRRYLIDKNLISHVDLFNNKLILMPEEEKIAIEENLIRKKLTIKNGFI